MIYLLTLAVLLLTWRAVKDHYRLRTLENFAREWGAPLGTRGPCRGGAVKLRRVK
jgi:hypothetical protein